MTWELANCEDPKWHLPTVQIPHRRLREALSVGNFAQLIFVCDDVSQRLWVVIGERREIGKRYRGQLMNEPDQRIVGLRYGEMLEFGPEHICDWSPA